MFDLIRKMFSEILRENDEYSLTRLIALGSWVTLVAGSIYLLVIGKTWDHYDMFVTAFGINGMVGSLVNKFINSKYNSSYGQPPITNKLAAKD